MRAAYVERTGGPDELIIGTRPVPTPGPGQLLVRVRAASLNPRDWMVRAGSYPFRAALPPFPVTLGSDFSGEVVALGARATRFAVGDEVFGMQVLTGGFGAYAEYIAVDERVLARKPPGISHADAAAVPCAGLTAWQALHDIGRIGSGDQVVICGGSGVVGSYSVQFAKSSGALVIATTSVGNAALVRDLGADAVVDYKAEDFTAQVRGQALVFDAVGRTPFKAARRTLAPGGRYITTIPSARVLLAATATRIARIATFGRRTSAHLVLVRARGEELAAIAELMAQGRVRSHIDSRFPLAEARAAQERSRSWRARGKIILDVA